MKSQMTTSAVATMAGVKKIRASWGWGPRRRRLRRRAALNG
jgi:hypothetical protein